MANRTYAATRRGCQPRSRSVLKRLAKRSTTAEKSSPIGCERTRRECSGSSNPMCIVHETAGDNSDVSDGLYLAICAACAAAGFLIGRWRWAFGGPPAAWIAGVLIAALTGGFDATSEDNSLGVFVFTAVPALLWMLLAVAGICVRRVIDARRVHPSA